MKDEEEMIVAMETVAAVAENEMPQTCVPMQYWQPMTRAMADNSDVFVALVNALEAGVNPEGILADLDYRIANPDE